VSINFLTLFNGFDWDTWTFQNFAAGFVIDYAISAGNYSGDPGNNFWRISKRAGQIHGYIDNFGGYGGGIPPIPTPANWTPYADQYAVQSYDVNSRSLPSGPPQYTWYGDQFTDIVNDSVRLFCTIDISGTGYPTLVIENRSTAQIWYNVQVNRYINL
jgi:hypothetical protein